MSQSLIPGKSLYFTQRGLSSYQHQHGNFTPLVIHATAGPPITIAPHGPLANTEPGKKEEKKGEEEEKSQPQVISSVLTAVTTAADERGMRGTHWHRVPTPSANTRKRYTPRLLASNLGTGVKLNNQVLRLFSFLPS